MLGEWDCVLVTSGMGLVRALDGTRALLEGTKPQLLISFGIAGAIEVELHIGDVVISSKTALLENGRTAQAQALTNPSQPAWEAIRRTLEPMGASLTSGTAVTTRGSQVFLKGQSEIIHPILEMETAGIAQAAAAAGIPLLSIRSISDGPEAPIPFDLEKIMDEEYNLMPGKLIQAILRDPRILLKSRRMIRNSGRAAEHAALAVIAALSQPGVLIAG